MAPVPDLFKPFVAKLDELVAMWKIFQRLKDKGVLVFAILVLEGGKYKPAHESGFQVRHSLWVIANLLQLVV